eukprot:UN05188
MMNVFITLSHMVLSMVSFFLDNKLDINSNKLVMLYVLHHLSLNLDHNCTSYHMMSPFL